MGCHLFWGHLFWGPNKIIRGKRLLHPFVSIGSVTKRIELVPDYLFEVNGKIAWLLEAKSPNEEILNSKHVEQAYSYAIHSEIRVPYFALCNGREFVLYHVSQPKPVIHFRTLCIASFWDNLMKLLRPENVLQYDFKLAKDFGLHLKRIGFSGYSSLVFPDVPIGFIAQIASDVYTFGSGVKPEGTDTYVATFDFNATVLEQLRGKIPDRAFEILSEPFAASIRQVNFTNALYRVTVDCRVGEKLEENEDEIFLPLWINKVLG